MLKKNKGFTLIELLVVIAIIGILSAIVLVSLGSARNKAKDTAIKADLSNLRSAAELYAMDHQEHYTGFCTETGGDAQRAKANIEANGATWHCYDSDSAWAACADLQSKSNSYFCVDSTGVAKETTSVCSTTHCP